MIEANSIEDVHEVIRNNTAVVVLFTQPRTCIPCRNFRPHYEKAAEKFDATFLYVDLDRVPDVVLEYGIQSVPTVMLYHGGKFEKNLQERTVIKLLAEIQP